MPGDSAFWSSRSRHKPPHLYVGGMAHMITASTIQHGHILAPTSRKDLFLRTLGEICLAWGITIIAWVVLDDHYHAILVPADAQHAARAALAARQYRHAVQP